FPLSNHEALIDSIVTKLWPMGDDTSFIPGHGQPGRFGQERQTNPFVADSVLAGRGVANGR
ncbi:MBL fold metallo-hydrolase, partial [Sphingomonas sp. ABOLD]